MRSKLLLIALILGVAFTVFSMKYLIEEYQTQVWLGESDEAKRNPFLAAQRFLESRGVKVITSNDKLDFEKIPSSETVFLSKVDSMLVSQSQVDSALAWINRGGYLIVGVGDEIEGQASILKHFDIMPNKQEVTIDDLFLNEDGEAMTGSERMREVNRQIEERRATQKEKEDKEASGDEAKTESDAPKQRLNEDDDFTEQLFDLLNIEYKHEYYSVDLSEVKEEIHLAVLDRILLNHDAIFDSENAEGNDYTITTWVNDENGERLIQFSYGAGTFTALSSSELWENGYIGLADHAFFLSYLVPDQSTLHLLYNVTAPSLSSILYRYFYEFIWTGLLLLALWLWNRGIRVERAVQTTEGQRRSFAEHLSSGAEFLLKNKQYQALIQPIQEDIEQQMRPFYPSFSQLNEHSQAAMLAERTNLPEPTLHDWLRYCQKVENNGELFAALKIGNAIRNKL